MLRVELLDAPLDLGFVGGQRGEVLGDVTLRDACSDDASNSSSINTAGVAAWGRYTP